MITKIPELIQYILPVLILAAGIFAGIFFQKVTINKLLKITSRTKYRLDDVLVRSFKGVIVFWFFILSLYIIIQITKLPIKTIHIINQAMLSVFIFSITLLIANIVGGMVQSSANSMKKSFIPTTIFRTIAKVLIMVIGILVVLQTLGISITPLLTALGVGGLAVALALKDTLSNLFAGIQIIFSGQLKPGDFIRLESGEEGYVTDITWRNTTIRQLPENLIIIPNSKLSDSMIINYNLPKAFLNVISEIGVSYSSDLDKVERVTLKTAIKIMKSVEGAVPDFEPVLRYTKFDDFSINFRVIMRAKDFKAKYLVEHEFIKELHKAYHKEKIEIPFPIRTVYMKK
ncbi:MAG: mechanosensitive ion channel family protein [Spirochaetes bacterium]|nr:mechanosensitive ion channel family protein [Spirochaetota bacterium]